MGDNFRIGNAFMNGYQHLTTGKVPRRPHLDEHTELLDLVSAALYAALDVVAD